jgi:hypothetical protein
MEITSLTFAGFVILVFIVYHLLPQRPQNYWLLITSLAFYCTFAWQFAVVLLALTILNFFIGKRLASGERRSLLWAGIVLNAAALLAFKYADFYLPAVTKLLDKLGVETGAGGLQILLPVGLSFYVVRRSPTWSTCTASARPRKKTWWISRCSSCISLNWSPGQSSGRGNSCRNSSSPGGWTTSC